MHSPLHAHNAVHCKAALQHEQFPRHPVLQRQRKSALHVVDTSERELQNGFQPSAVCNKKGRRKIDNWGVGHVFIHSCSQTVKAIDFKI